jgi:hypothetical protein
MNGASYELMTAIRGPIMLITLGALVAIHYFTGYEFGRTWPVLFIMFGLLKLLERVSVRPVPPGDYNNLPAPPRGGAI